VTSARVTVVMCVHNQLDLTRACLESLRATTEPFELVVVDSGSTDGTGAFVAGLDWPRPLHYERSDINPSVIGQLNRGWRRARTDVVCLLHNDTEMVEPRWLTRLLHALDEPGAGLAGLYGAKRVRRDGALVGRTIVHSLATGPTVRPPWEEVAFVDSVCLCLPRELLASVGGLDEGYGFQHGLDRELSFAVREAGRRCLVVHAPFHHRGGATRTRDFVARPELERADLASRERAIARFVGRWRHRLPADVRPVPERFRDWWRATVGA
jgi:GT2 family glycosyltransferase